MSWTTSFDQLRRNFQGKLKLSVNLTFNKFVGWDLKNLKLFIVFFFFQKLLCLFEKQFLGIYSFIYIAVGLLKSNKFKFFLILYELHTYKQNHFNYSLFLKKTLV